MDERQLGTVTVLFTDAVSSTADRRRLGDARAEQLREKVDSVQAEAVERHHGRVVKGTGDGVMAVFQSAGDGLAAAAEIVARTEAVTQTGGTPVTLRVGLSAGDVSQVEEDVFGTPVVEAARLCAAAAGNEIFLSEVVRILAGSWSDLPLIDRGDIALSGLGSVGHWSLDWTALRSQPGEGVGILVDEEFAFVGRAAELSALHEVWGRVTQGERHAVLLTGEAGAGKSRLVVEMGRAIRLSGGLVLSGRCEEGVTAPLLPFQGAVGMYLREHDVETVTADAGPFINELGRHFPLLAAAIGSRPGKPDPDPETERWRLLAGLAHLLRAVAARRSVALIIDDVQWSDAATRAFVEQILREAGVQDVGIFITSRDSGGAGASEIATWIAHVERLPRVHRIRVSGLEPVDLVSLVATSDVEVDAADLWEQTKGNPFFVSELVRYARAYDGVAARVPASIQDLLESRLEGLDTATIDLLTAGAVAGSEFDVELVGEIAGLGESQAVRAAEEAVRARMVIEVPDRFDRFQFTHRLVTDVISARTSESRRIRLHRDIAAALSRRGDSSAEVARHTLAAAPLVGIQQAVDVSRRAAQEAVDSGSPDQGVSLLKAALELAVDAVTRIELDLAVGVALNFGGRPAEGVPWFEAAAAAAIEEDHFDLLAEAALGCWAGNPWTANVDRRAPDLLREALARCPDDASILRARLQAGLAAFSIFSAPLEERERVTAEAVALARSTGDTATLAATLASRHTAINCPAAIDDVDQVDRELAAMTTHADPAVPQLVEVPIASVPSLLVGVSSPQYWRADGAAYRAAARAFALDDPRTPDWVATVGYQLEAGVAILDGRLAEARSSADRAVEIGGWGDASLGNHMWQRLVIDWLGGDVANSRQRVADLYQRFGGQPMRCTLAWIEAASGNESEARQLLERVGVRRLHRLPELFLGTIALATCAIAVSHLSDQEWADAVISAFDPVAELVCGVPWTPLPAGHFFVGLMHRVLADPATAGGAFGKAARVHARLGAPAFDALTLAEHGRTIADIDPPRASRLLAEANSLSSALGLNGVKSIASPAT